MQSTSSHPVTLNFKLFYLRPAYSNGLFPSDQKPATFPTCLIQLHSITRMKLGEQQYYVVPRYEVFSSSFCVSSLVGPDISFSISHLNTHILHSSLNVRYQASPSYKTTFRVIVQYILSYPWIVFFLCLLYKVVFPDIFKFTACSEVKPWCNWAPGGLTSKAVLRNMGFSEQR